MSLYTFTCIYTYIHNTSGNLHFRPGQKVDQGGIRVCMKTMCRKLALAAGKRTEVGASLNNTGISFAVPIDLHF